MAHPFKPLTRETPLSHGLPPLALDRFYEALGKTTARMRGVMLLRDGRVIGERFWAPYQPEDKVWVYSLSKSFCSTAAGFAYDEGRLGLDDTVVSFFPDKCPGEIPDRLGRMRVRDLLSMTSGHAEDTTVAVMSTPGGDWIRTFLGLPLTYEPGTHFLYNSGATFMVAAIVQKVTGERLMEYLTPRLFAPLGFDAVVWDENPQGIATGGWGFVVRLEDLAKLGQLYLNRGLWEGQRVLSEDWVAQATAKQADNAHHASEGNPDWGQGYGFQFWRCQHGAFRGDGAAGQYLVVMPEQNAVLAVMSEVGDMQQIMDALWQTLLPAFDSLFSPAETATGGRRYRLEPNDPGLETMTVDFSQERLTLRFTAADGDLTLSAGRGVWAACDAALPFGLPVFTPPFTVSAFQHRLYTTFSWTAPDTLTLDWYYRQTPHTGRLSLRFDASTLTLTLPPSPIAAMTGAKEIVIKGQAE